MDINSVVWEELKVVGETATASAIREASKSLKKAYIGAHALRHWFTMYLVVHAGLDNVTVSRLRGDKSLETLEDYLHINASMLKLYEESTCLLQRWILEHSR